MQMKCGESRGVSRALLSHGELAGKVTLTLMGVRTPAALHAAEGKQKGNSMYKAKKYGAAVSRLHLAGVNCMHCIP